MLSLYTKVKETRLMQLTEKMEDLSYRIQFITAVLDDKIKIFRRAKKDIIVDMGKQKPAIPERYLKMVRAEEFTNEEIEDSKKEIAKLKALHEATLKLEPETLWLDKLTALETYLKKEHF